MSAPKPPREVRVAMTATICGSARAAEAIVDLNDSIEDGIEAARAGALAAGESEEEASAMAMRMADEVRSMYIGLRASGLDALAARAATSTYIGNAVGAAVRKARALDDARLRPPGLPS